MHDGTAFPETRPDTEIRKPLQQLFSTRVPRNPGVRTVTARGSTRSYTNSLSSNRPYLLIDGGKQSSVIFRSPSQLDIQSQ